MDKKLQYTMIAVTVFFVSLLLLFSGFINWADSLRNEIAVLLLMLLAAGIFAPIPFIICLWLGVVLSKNSCCQNILSWFLKLNYYLKAFLLLIIFIPFVFIFGMAGSNRGWQGLEFVVLSFAFGGICIVILLSVIIRFVIKLVKKQ